MHENPHRPCSECGGRGVVVVQTTTTRNGKQVPVTGTRACPVCRGSRRSSGLATK